jgi:hypothetical protein
MNGSGIPFVGTSASTTLIKQGLSDDAYDDADPEEHAKRVGRPQLARIPRQRKTAKTVTMTMRRPVPTLHPRLRK